MENGTASAFSRMPHTILVVVHILYKNPEENISDRQVWSQIDALNRDFNKKNPNLNIIPSEFAPLIGDVGFEFCLATMDPEGNPTTGITRKETFPDNIFSRNATWIYYSVEGGQDAWDPQKYLNIWVAETTQNIIGYGSKPGERKLGEDGVVIGIQYFGTCGLTTRPFHLGRSGTHEVGHYFNLFHPWGTEISCEVDDFVADTPLQAAQYHGCPDNKSVSCGSRDITSNFMNFSFDACLAMFTKGQAQRMQAALVGARAGLLESAGCNEKRSGANSFLKVYPNPVNDHFCVETNFEFSRLIPFKMIDTNGRIVRKGTVSSNSITPIPSFQNGIYWLQFFTEEEPILKKIIITRQ